jgi:hypothetical protein
MDTQSGGVAFISGATFQQTMLPAKVIYRGWATAVPSPTQSVLPLSMNAPDLTGAGVRGAFTSKGKAILSGFCMTHLLKTAKEGMLQPSSCPYW